MNKFIFLSPKFYSTYPHPQYPEIEYKQNRPYIQILLTVNNVTFAVPLRSNINHPYVFWTDKANKCGVDYTKAVVIHDPEFIDTTRVPYIRPNEFNALRGKEKILSQGLSRYLNDYKNARSNLSDKINLTIYNYSTLKYFDIYL